MLVASIREAARRFGERPLFIDAEGRRWSYAAVDRRSDHVAAGLAASGVREGDTVALTLPSVPPYAVAYLAAAKVGAITAGVNSRLSEAERSALVDLAAPRLVIESAEHVDALGRSGGESTDLAPRSDRPVAIVFTSGTTGAPKGAVFDEARITAIVATDLGLTTWDGGGPMLSSTEFCHVGFTTKLAWYVRRGVTQVLMKRWMADAALRLAAEHRMESLGGVPPQFALMLRSPAFHTTDLSAVKTITLGGGPASPSLRAEIIDRFRAQLSVRYSCTESGGCGTGTDPGAPDEEALFTEGRPRGEVEVAIRDGEVCLRTPTAMVGYWHDAEATTSAFHSDGFVRTGDQGEIDDAGCLRLHGRSKEMYVRGGYNVFPAEVEAVLARHPQIAEVAVVPRPDDVMGEVGVAAVVPRGQMPSLAELRAFAAASLASYKLPDDVVAIETLPLTAMHKVDRRALGALLRAGAGYPAGA